MKFGTCCNPKMLGFPGASFSQNVETLRAAGAQFLEFPVSSVHAEGDAREFDALQAALKNVPLRVEAFNVFLPAHHRITGPDVNLESVLAYSRVALARCKALGGEIVVLGSAGARKVSADFDLPTAQKQFAAFCRELAPVAAETEIMICIEPLNHRDDNLILSVEHGARIVDEVAHPSIQLLADFYHIMVEEEPLENIAAAGARLKHTHVADKGRVAPGFSSEGEADFIGFFGALHRAGYDSSTPDARCSFEGSAPDLFKQAAPMFELLRRRNQEAAGEAIS
jgi:sugar phosphate isomerase/epimerase